MSKTEDSIKFFANVYCRQYVDDFFNKHYEDVMKHKIHDQLTEELTDYGIKATIESAIMEFNRNNESRMDRLEKRQNLIAQNMDAIYSQIQR